MASGIQDLAKSEIPVKAFGRGFRCAEEPRRKAFRDTHPADVALFMKLESLPAC